MKKNVLNMKNMIRRRKKKIKKKSCLDLCDQHHVLNSRSSSINISPAISPEHRGTLCTPESSYSLGSAFQSLFRRGSVNQKRTVRVLAALQGTRSDSMSAEMMCQLYEGQLYKYTNVMKGWQFRWFILDPKTGILNYYLSEAESRQAPRGWVHLEAAVISPSEEDSNTFTVNSSSGEMFKLRAQDARARQEWVNRLRAVAELHAMAVAHNNPPLLPREHMTPVNLQSSSTLAVWDAFSAVKDHLFRAEQSNFLLARAIDDLPSCGDVRHVDPELLLLKAASHAMLLSLSQCLYILQHQQSASDGLSSSHYYKKSSSDNPSNSSHSKKKFAL